ncbi:unnamed protein product, partial [Owenia fusiformis]
LRQYTTHGSAVCREMPVITEVSSMFWGVTLDEGKRYTQTVERSFHISAATLEPKDSAKHKPVSVMISTNKAEFLLAVLQHGKTYNQQLDLNFTEGEEVTFFLNGEGVVHLTGYLVEDDIDQQDFEGMEEMSDESGEEESSEDEEIPKLKAIEALKKSKRKNAEEATGKKKKQKVVVEEDEDSDEEDDDFMLDEAEESDEDSEEDSEMEDDDDDDDEEDSGEEE